MCYFLVIVQSKKYDTARDCVAFVPGTSDPNLYRNINFINVPINFNNHEISPSNHHIIPANTLRRFFNSALHSNNHRVPFIRVLELSHFARGKYLQSVSHDLKHFIDDLDHVRFNVCESNQWNQMSKESRERITRALDHYGRFVRSMFIMMPLNLVKGPAKKCDAAITGFDENFRHIVGHKHIEKLKSIYNAMESNDLSSAINLLFAILQDSPRERPYEYHERNWRFNSDKNCYEINTNQMDSKQNSAMDKDTTNYRWEYNYGVQFPFTIHRRQYFYAQNTETRHWFIQELLINGKVGDETDTGHWNNIYRVQFPFSVGGKQYFYAQNTDTRYWFIQELLPNGKMGVETDNGRWDNVYRIQFPFSFGGKQYFYGQNTNTRFWFIQELLANGKMGVETDNGFWGHVQKTNIKTEL